MHLVTCRMNRGVAPSVAEPRSHSVMAMVNMAIGPHGKCSPQYVPSVAKTRKYLSSLAKIDRCIAAIATTRSNKTNRDGSTLKIYIGWGDLAYVYFTSLFLTLAELTHPPNESCIPPLITRLIPSLPSTDHSTPPAISRAISSQKVDLPP